MAAAVLGILIVTATLTGCSSSNGPSDSTTPTRTSSLASALDLVPDMPDGYALFTDWSMAGHGDHPDPKTALFAKQLLTVDDALQQDLGIRSTNADWELDVWQPGRPATVVLRYEAHTDLAGLPGKLTRSGYHADGSIFTGSPEPARMWTVPLRNIGIDPGRHLLIGGSDASAVRSLLAGSAHSLGHADAVTPLLALASIRLERIGTAAIVVGPSACVALADLIGKGRATPAMLAAVRERFTGTFTPPQAKITALADPTSTTELAALTFPDHDTAQANQAGRSAAAQMGSAMVYGNQDEIRATGSTVTGRVLSFNLTAKQPQDFPHQVMANGLGVDICP